MICFVSKKVSDMISHSDMISRDICFVLEKYQIRYLMTCFVSKKLSDILLRSSHYSPGVWIY